MSDRGSGWKRIRNFVLERDNNICAYCGGDANSVDHIIPWAYSQDNSYENLVAACRECNSIGVPKQTHVEKINTVKKRSALMPAHLSRIQIVQRGIASIESKVTDGILTQRAQAVLLEAKRLAPKSDGVHSYTDGVPYRTAGGRFANGLTIGKTFANGKQVIRIFSNSVFNQRGQPYPIWLLRGTRPHIISAHDSNNKPLYFRWIRRGVFMIAKDTRHMGTQPNNNWIIEALRKLQTG